MVRTAHPFRGFLCLYIFLRLFFFPDGSQLWFLTGFFLVLIIVVTLVGNFMVTRSKVEMIGNWLWLQTCSGSLCARHRKDSSTTVQLFSLFSRLRWLGGARQHKCLSYIIDLAPLTFGFNRSASLWWSLAWYTRLVEPGPLESSSVRWAHFCAKFLCYLDRWWNTDFIQLGN